MGTIAIVLLLLVSVSAYDHGLHRHRHSRSQSEAHDLDRLMNRLDLHTTRTPVDTPVPSDPDLEPGNSLWDNDFEIGESSSVSPLDAERWDKILTEKEKQREDREDAEDEQEERSAEEDGFEDQKEQADSYKPWNSRSGESSFTNWKWENLGNRKSVDNLFQIYRSGQLKPDSTSKESIAQYEVYKHNKQMSRETLCRVPRPKVVKVSDVYPSTSKLYVPACTVLHQCGEDTGCCGGTAQRCGPRTTKRVELYFYTTYMVPNRQRSSSGLEKLPFYNHTECECQDRLEEAMPRDGQSADYRAERTPELGCKCPSEYTVRRLANGSCACDCFDKQRDCIKFKRGNVYFNHTDRLCIEMGTCQLPACDFGAYLRSSGRCPRKHEKYRSWSRHH